MPGCIGEDAGGNLQAADGVTLNNRVLTGEQNLTHSDLDIDGGTTNMPIFTTFAYQTTGGHNVFHEAFSYESFRDNIANMIVGPILSNLGCI